MNEDEIEETPSFGYVVAGFCIGLFAIFIMGAVLATCMGL